MKAESETKMTIFFWAVAAILLLISFGESEAAEPKLDNLYIEAKKSIGTNRTPYMVPDEKRGELNLGLQYSVRRIYNRLKVTSFYGHQFRHVSLDTELGLKFDKFEVFVDHYSGHALDYQYEFKYPNMNSIGIRYNFK